jgi:hypothetical protein
MEMKFFLFFAVFSLMLNTYSQVEYVGDDMSKWENAYMNFYAAVKNYPGYRVQIFYESGNYSKNKALGVKAKFYSLYPDVPAYIVYQEPYYRVRVGNFRNKLEANAFKEAIKKEFPEAYVIRDNIDLPMVFNPKDLFK